MMLRKNYAEENTKLAGPQKDASDIKPGLAGPQKDASDTKPGLAGPQKDASDKILRSSRARRAESPRERERTCIFFR